MDKLRFLQSHAKIVLASESKPRAAVLAQAGLAFDTAVSGFPEDLPKESFSAEEYALTNAKIKAGIVSKKLKADVPNLLVVIGCDTVVEDESRSIIEKPASPDHTKSILKNLAGRTHRVITGVSIHVSNKNGRNLVERSFSEATEVRFANFSDDVIDAYIKSGEPMNKAGAYGIQGLGALLVESINGDFNNVVGLPLFRVFETIGSILDDI